MPESISEQPSASRPAAARLGVVASLVGGLVGGLVGCGSLSAVDRKTDELLRSSADRVGQMSATPTYDPARYEGGTAFPKATPDQDSPPSRNPSASELEVPVRDAAADSAEAVIDRFRAMVADPAGAELITFEEAFRFAQGNATEYLTAEESYIITALRLIIEENRWGPRFFNETGANLIASGDENGRYDTTLNLVNDLGVTQRLPYGGDVSARLLVAATEQLDDAIFDDSSQSADILLNANIPILRGAGLTAREPLIQARRDLIYAARSFESFRRGFYLSLASEYLQLIFRKNQIANAQRQVEQSRLVEQRTTALVEAGRSEPFEADQARQNSLFAIDRLANLQDSYRFALDAFKLRIGMDTSRPIEISEEAFDLPVPSTALDEAVAIALRNRLDLQTESDRVADARRRVDLAKNETLGDLDLRLSADIPTTETKRRAGLQFRPQSTDYVAGITYSMPLDRTAEEAFYRETQIRLEQTRRDLRQFEDRIAVEARQSVRSIERAQFSLLIAQRNVETSENRLAAIDAAPDRATVRDRTEAVNNLQAAQDQLSSAARDLQIAILALLDSTGQLRVNREGLLELPGGMAAVAGVR